MSEYEYDEDEETLAEDCLLAAMGFDDDELDEEDED